MWEDINGYKYAETLYDPGADKFLTKAEYLEMRVADPGFFIVVYMPPPQRVNEISADHSAHGGCIRCDAGCRQPPDAIFCWPACQAIEH